MLVKNNKSQANNNKQYWKPSLAADIVVFVVNNTKVSKLKLLLVKRKNKPYKNYWALPGGFLNEGETLREAGSRELFEETGVKNIDLKQLAIWDDPARDPRSRVISVSFVAKAILEDLNIKAGDDASEVELFSVSMLKSNGKLLLELFNIKNKLNVKLEEKYSNTPSNQYKIKQNNYIAFDHAKIISFALNKLLKSLDNNDIISSNGIIQLRAISFKKLLTNIRG